ncbi:MAG TPA: hypothetical protein VKM55_07220 [Candidatus Lokiarchaeia archaeon]|nr:hypothetical protein [Candidatus Lokiarchaeia archaeon]
MPLCPLGMPEGTVRAYLSIIVVAFPFLFVWQGLAIPNLLSNLLFLVCAFYFEKRSTKVTAKAVIGEFMDVDDHTPKKRDSLPLYLPKYSVRTLLIVLIIALLINSYSSTIGTITSENTFANLLITLGAFVVGLAGRRLGNNMIARRIRWHAKIKKISLSEAANEIDPALKRSSAILESILSIIVIIAVISSLFMFTFNFDISIPFFGIVVVSTRENLLQLLSLYYGFRQ